VRFQSPDGDSVVSHYVDVFPNQQAPMGFQSPDGDSVVSHYRFEELDNHPGFTAGFSPLTGIPWFPTTALFIAVIDRDFVFQSPDGDSVVSHGEAQVSASL